MTSWPKVTLGQAGVDLDIAQNRLTHWKSCLIIIYPNSHEKLIESEIMSSLNIAQNHFTYLAHIWSHIWDYLVIICPNSYDKFTKSKIRSSWSRFEYCSKSLV